MASPQRLAFMLLVSWIFLLYWTASSAESHDHRPSTRIRRELRPGTREKVEKSLTVIKDVLTVVKEALASPEASAAIDMLKSISTFANMVPGIGGLVGSTINLVLVFIPQEDPSAKQIKEGFDQVNLKLDSLSTQISNLATDVKWFNYASVYSQDERSILNAWNKFNEFRQSSESAQSPEAKLQLAEMFTSYYESSGTEASVCNFYYYLTVSSTALSENLNKLLIDKFKCGVTDISRYNVYFSSLLWKGMVVSQVYWNLMGFYSLGKEEQHVKMFKKVHELQSSTVDFCLTNYKEYMKKDVEEITKKHIPNKDAIAEQVKAALDKKYNWYSWVVLVYDSNSESSYKLFDVTKIPVSNVIVVVAHTLKGKETDVDQVEETAKQCFHDKSCEIEAQISTCQMTPKHPWGLADSISPIVLTQHAKVTHVSKNGGQSFAERPTPLQQVDCRWSRSSGGKVSVHWSRRMEVCTDTTCQNNGKCKQLLDSNDWFCDCQDGYHGKTCDQKLDTSAAPDMKVLYPKGIVTTTSAKLKSIESKLDTMMSKCQRS